MAAGWTGSWARCGSLIGIWNPPHAYRFEAARMQDCGVKLCLPAATDSCSVSQEKGSEIIWCTDCQTQFDSPCPKTSETFRSSRGYMDQMRCDACSMLHFSLFEGLAKPSTSLHIREHKPPRSTDAEQ
jgi:hypothetical protein